MNLMRQICIVTTLNFKNLPRRFWTSMVIVTGLGATIGVLLAMLSLSTGMKQAYLNAGDPTRAIILSNGADGEGQSSISRADTALILDAPGIAKDASGKPMADRGLAVGIPVVRKNGSDGNTSLRGFGDKGVALRQEFHMVVGRMFRPGKREVIVGQGAQNQFQKLGIGDRIILPGGPWPIVGVYRTGDALDGQLIGDTETLMATTHKTTYNSILVRLTSYNSLAALKAALTTNPALSVTATRDTDWRAHLASQTATGLVIIANIVAIVMAIGALFGCLNTMYAAVSARGREIATLRALGFAAFPVAVSVIVEATLLAVAGALIGAAVIWALYDGRQDSFDNNVFYLTVSPAMVKLGVLWAVVVALLGGLAPSIRAARRPVVEALRAT